MAAPPQCKFSRGNNDQFTILEVELGKKGDNDFNANVVNIGNIQMELDQQNDEEVLATIISGATGDVSIREIELNIQVDNDKKLKIKKFNGEDPCDRDEDFTVQGVDFECTDGGTELESQGSSGGDNYDLIKVIDFIFDCPQPTASPTENPTKKPTLGPTANPTIGPTTNPTNNPTLSEVITAAPTNVDETPAPTDIDETGTPTLNPTTPAPTDSPMPGFPLNPAENNEDEANALMAAMAAAGSLIGVLVLCIAFMIVRRRHHEKERDILNADDSEINPYFKQNTTLVKVATPQQAQGYGADNANWRESMMKFDTNNLNRLSGLSMLTTNTVKSDVSKQDYDNHQKVRSVISEDKRRFSVLSQMVAQQVNRLSMNTLEIRNRDDDINERVLNKVVPFVKALVKPHQTKVSKMNKFNLKSAPRVSLKFYISRLIMGLNGWFYENMQSTEVGLRCLFLSLIYLDQLPEKVPGFEVTNLNIYKLLAIFMLIGAKFTEDDVITNSYWADVCGYTAKEVNELEALLCFQFQFSFDADPNDVTNLFKLFNEQQSLPDGMESAGGSMGKEVL